MKRVLFALGVAIALVGCQGGAPEPKVANENTPPVEGGNTEPSGGTIAPAEGYNDKKPGSKLKGN